MRVHSAILMHNLTTTTCSILQSLVPILIEIILEGIAHVIVHLHLGVECCYLLTFCYHGEDATNDHGTASINLCFTLEHFWEVLRHAFTNAMMLTFTN